MRIDSHQHFWKYKPERYPWITSGMNVLRRDYLPPDLLPLLEQQHIEGCIAVQADMSTSETEFLLECAGEYPFIRGVVGWVNLRDERCGEQLEKLAANPKLKGIRHIVQDEPDDHFMLRQDFQEGIARLGRFQLVYDLLVFPRQLPAAIALAREFPEQRFVLDHIGKPPISDGNSLPWKRYIHSLAELPNVYCKVSGMVTETRNFKWKKEDFRPFLDEVLDAFGTQRLMFGSDWPVCLLAASYESVHEIVADYLKDLSEVEKSAIFGGNAIDYYRLQPANEPEK